MVLMFTSGHMYNHIRKVPYVTGNGKGGITYFAGGFSNQFGIETQIIAAVCKLSPYRFVIVRHANLVRCCSFLCNHLSWSESTSNEGCTDAASRSHNLGFCDLWHVQLSDELVQNKEWRLSVLVASILRIVQYYGLAKPKADGGSRADVHRFDHENIVHLRPHELAFSPQAGVSSTLA